MIRPIGRDTYKPGTLGHHAGIVERVTAAELKPGDIFAETCSHPLMRAEVSPPVLPGARARWIHLRDGSGFWARLTAEFWREVRL